MPKTQASSIDTTVIDLVRKEHSLLNGILRAANDALEEARARRNRAFHYLLAGPLVALVALFWGLMPDAPRGLLAAGTALAVIVLVASVVMAQWGVLTTKKLVAKAKEALDENQRQMEFQTNLAARKAAGIRK